MVNSTIKDSERYIISSIDKALDVLELIAEKETINLMELAQITGKPKSSLFRILSTLEHKGYVARSEDDEKYCVGLKPLKLTKSLLESNSLREASLKEMGALSKKYGDSVNLGVFTGNEVLYIAIIEGTYPLGFKDVIGSRAPFHASAIGKAIVAYLKESEFENILAINELSQITPYTFTDKNKFQAEIKRVKNNGYALDDQEVVEGARCIAAPIFNVFGDVVAAISLSGPIHRYANEDIDSISLEVKLSAKNISRKLGFNV